MPTLLDDDLHQSKDGFENHPDATKKGAYNPGEAEYHRNFDTLDGARADGARREHFNSAMAKDQTDRTNSFAKDRRSLGEREAAPSWDTNLGRGQVRDMKEPSNDKNGLSKIAKSRIGKWVAGGLISSVFAAGVAMPAVMTQVASNLKTIGTDWANKNNKSFFSKYVAKYMKKKFFNKADPKADSSKVKDRFNAGISEEEIDKMKNSNLFPHVADAGDKKYLTGIDFYDANGDKTTVNPDKFDDFYRTNTSFRSKMDKVAKPGSMLMRGAQTLKLIFNKFKIKRNLSVDGENDRERNKSFRATIYGEGNDTQKANAPPSEGEGEKDQNTTDQIGEVDDSIQEAARQERDRMVSSGYDVGPSIVPDTSNLDLSPDHAVDAANGALGGGLKGAFLGIFSAADKGCSFFQMIRAGIFGAKVWKVIGLIKYVGTFYVIFDKIRSGDGGAAELAYMMGILLKPSKKSDSLGKTFFQSTGWNLIFQGKVADSRGLGRFTTATPYIKYFQRALSFLGGLGINKTTCKQIKSWYGQAALFIAGLSLTIFSAGTLAVAGAIASAALGMIVSVMVSYVTPLLIQYAAGTVAPDPNDEEGGYAAGNAIGAALGAFGFMTGRANGLAALTKSEAGTVDMESNKEIAFEKAVENQHKNPFSLDSADSIPSKLAFAVAPYMSSFYAQGSVQSVASVFAAPFTMFGSSLGTIFSGSVMAQADTSNRQGEFCADQDYADLQLAVDANCNPIPGVKDAIIDDPKYDPENVLKYMIDNNHIDPDSGAPKSDDYNKFIRSCVGTEDDIPPPLSPDGGASDVGEDVDTRWCINQDEKFNMFRFYTAETAIDKAHTASVKGTLGIDESTSNTGGSGLTGQTFQNGRIPDGALCPLGDAWPGKKLRCDAAKAFTSLNNAYKQQFGSNIVVDDSYRDYDAQVQCRKEKGDLCAEPGKSNHGCGQAVDLGGGLNSFGTPQYNWLLNNGTPFGWTKPAWAAQNGSKPEAWHWEYGTNGQSNDGTCHT